MTELIDESIKDTILKIGDLFNKGKFNNYIEYMVFPYYKNLLENSRINLDFPVAILVGKNGSGKSSTLHAFYGAPKNKSVGEYWFSTNLDPIKEDFNRNRFFYGYKEDKVSEIKEVRKARIKRSRSKQKKADPDYWEPTRVAITDGMKNVDDESKRNDPVSKDVIYVDFRRELSAFDKYFYFAKENKDETKQDFLRKRAVFLKKLFDTNNPSYYRAKKEVVMKDVIKLGLKEINVINEILNKNYTEIKMVEHKLFDFWGTSIYVKTTTSHYSEANAGSGEIAIIKLVYKIINSKPFSLILLDEPEVSLHPSAQKKLKLFLLQEALNKKHQIIISTHSHEIIDSMPSQALKLFQVTVNGRFQIKNDIQPTEAFYSIEEVVTDKISIICEDEAAKIILELVAEKLGKRQFFDIKYYPGGAETIFTKYIPVFCKVDKLGKRTYVFFDGDKYKGDSVNPSDISRKATCTDLEGIVKDSTGCNNVMPYVDGSNGTGREDQKNEFLLKYLKYLYENVKYFPANTIPELILLKSKEGMQKIKSLGIDKDDITISDAKEIIKHISEDMFGIVTSDYCNSTIRYLAKQWVKEETEDDFLKYIKSELIKIYNSFNQEKRNHKI